MRDAGLSITSPICRNHDQNVLNLIVKHRNVSMLKWTIERYPLSDSDKHSTLLAIIRDLSYEIDIDIIEELISAGACLQPNDCCLFNVNLLRQKHAFRSKHFFASSLNDKLLLCLCKLIDYSYKQWSRPLDYRVSTNLLRTVLECNRATMVQNQSARFASDIKMVMERLLSLGADVTQCCESTRTNDQHIYTFQHFEVLIRAAHTKTALTCVTGVMLSDRHGYTPPLYTYEEDAFLNDVKLLNNAGHRVKYPDICNFSKDVQREVCRIYEEPKSLRCLAVIAIRHAMKAQNVYHALEQWTDLPKLMKSHILLPNVH